MTPEEVTDQAVEQSANPDLTKLARFAVQHMEGQFIAADIWDELDVDEEMYEPRSMGHTMRTLAREGLIIPRKDLPPARAKSEERRKRNHNREMLQWEAVAR